MSDVAVVDGKRNSHGKKERKKERKEKATHAESLHVSKVKSSKSSVLDFFMMGLHSKTHSHLGYKDACMLRKAQMCTARLRQIRTVQTSKAPRQVPHQVISIKP